jgi:hypothetical protein
MNDKNIMNKIIENEIILHNLKMFGYQILIGAPP